MVYAKFDVNKHKNIFDGMYGKGAYDKGMAQARKIGTTTAQAKFAEQDYMQRLRDAQAAAKQAQQEAEAKTKADVEAKKNYGSGTDELIDQFRKEKKQSQKSGIDKYYENESKRLNKGRSLAMRKVEDIMPSAIPSLRDNPNLTAWEKIKLFGG